MRDAGWKRYENLEAAYWRFDALHNPHYHSVNPKMVGPMSERDAFKSVLAVEIATLEEELEQWRSGKRRVWWRTRWDDGGRADFTHLKKRNKPPTRRPRADRE
jgi:hypothetical protein